MLTPAQMAATTANEPSTITSAKPRRLMVDMFNLSQKAADTAFSVFNILSIIGAALVFVSVIRIFWSSGIRERFSDERIARNEKETAQANERAANAELETAKARLATEQLRQQIASRTLAPQQAQKLTAALKAVRTQLPKIRIDLLGDREAHTYGVQIVNAIESAGIQAEVIVTGSLGHPLYGLTLSDDKNGHVQRAFVNAGIRFDGVWHGGPPAVSIWLKHPPD
jgi:hypothetical protein